MRAKPRLLASLSVSGSCQADSIRLQIGKTPTSRRDLRIARSKPSAFPIRCGGNRHNERFVLLLQAGAQISIKKTDRELLRGEESFHIHMMSICYSTYTGNITCTGEPRKSIGRMPIGYCHGRSIPTIQAGLPASPVEQTVAQHEAQSSNSGRLQRKELGRAKDQ
jgi:hypothetical protein